MAKGEQEAFAGFDQKRIPAIERIASKFDEKRALVGGLKGEMDNHEFKLREAMHANEKELDKQQGADGETLLVYKRGDFNVVVKTKESLNVKIKAGSSGAEPEGE
jgi:hypothetical protein